MDNQMDNSTWKETEQMPLLEKWFKLILDSMEPKEIIMSIKECQKYGEILMLTMME